MSYEGVEQFICPAGHFYEIDSRALMYGDAVCECPVCTATPVWVCSVNYTNGYYEEGPQTYSGPRQEIGFEDDWKVDHYGNKYAVKILLFKPVLETNRWEKWETPV